MLALFKVFDNSIDVRFTPVSDRRADILDHLIGAGECSGASGAWNIVASIRKGSIGSID